MSLTRVWRWLTWLQPLACLLPGTYLAASVPGLAAAPAADPWVAIGILFLILTGMAVVALLAIGVAAAVAAWRGLHVFALLLLAVICAVTLAGALPLAPPGSVLAPLFAVPGLVAAGLAITGLPLLRRGPILAVVAVLALLAVPVITAAAAQIKRNQYFANDCPPGPAMDLTLTGPAAGHYTVACALPKSGRELTGCRGGLADVAFFTGQTVWSLSLPAAAAGITVSPGRPGPTPELLAGDQSYGGAYGWSGSYTFDANSPCSGKIDADLVGPPPAGRPVHISGRFATVLGSA